MDRPNLLLIHCHDLGRHLNLYGATSVNSPNLDALASQGVTATAMFASAPQCSPSRASLFTGRWPHSNGVMGLTHRGFAWDLHPDEQHLAQRLHDAGYRTELIGVHHESRVRADEEVATTLGFDRVRTGGYAETVVRRGRDALSRMVASDQPCYLQIGFQEPHRLVGRGDAPGVMGFLGDHVAPDASRGVELPGYLQDTASAREEVAELQGAIRHMDAGVGELLRELDRLALAENTITIFTTDHGLALPRAKCSLYDPGLEVAFIVRWPAGGWTGGVRLTEPLLNLDVVPTLLDALGLLPAGQDAQRPLQGRSFLPLLTATGLPAPRDAIYGEMTYHDYYDPRRAVRTARYKLIANFSSAPGYMDPSQSWNRRCATVSGASYGHEDYHPTVELYDLAADPLELVDLATDPAHAGACTDLLSRLYQWMSETDDPLLHGAVTSPLHRSTLAALDHAAASSAS